MRGEKIKYFLLNIFRIAVNNFAVRKEHFMKSIVFFSLVLLSCALLALAFPTDAEAQIYENTLRLHILANSDSQTDQSLKLEIRDRILKKYSQTLTKSTDINSALELTEGLVDDIEEDVKIWLTELGYDYSASASLGREWYDTRVYEDFTLPKGEYASLKIVIGAGEGNNWWCVMYPPLCMDIATESAPADDALLDYSNEEISLIKGGKYTVKFKILEIISSAFTKNG